jgi:hypothetical protein
MCHINVYIPPKASYGSGFVCGTSLSLAAGMLMQPGDAVNVHSITRARLECVNKNMRTRMAHFYGKIQCFASDIMRKVSGRLQHTK